jgi:Flp pilus assembly protein TadG
MRKFFKRDKENGNAFIMYILLLPLLMGFFGYAVDAGISYYTRTGMQNALDSAAVAGAAQVNYNSSGTYVINVDRAKTQAIAAMKVSLQQYPNIECKEYNCYNVNATILHNVAGRGDVLQLTLTEKSKTLFLHIIGIREQSYNLKSEARIGYIQQ